MSLSITNQPPINEHLKFKDFGGCLQEVVTYKSRTTGCLFWEEVQTQLLYGQ